MKLRGSSRRHARRRSGALRLAARAGLNAQLRIARCRRCLSSCGLRGDWETFTLRSKALAPPRPDRWLDANGRLWGPVKWVARRARPPICRADVPRHWPAAGKGGADGFASASRSFHADSDGLERPSYDHDSDGLERPFYDRAAWLSPRQAWAAAMTDFARQAAGVTMEPLPLSGWPRNCSRSAAR